MRIAMWSGPRNLSTALMYSFAQRPDCAVWDEPFYAAYLETTGLAHPMRTEIVADGHRDPAEVVSRLLGPIPEGKSVYYLKLMTHHMVPGFPRSWMTGARNVFLLRHPARVVASYVRKREAPTLDDLGFRQQYELFQKLRDSGQQPVVIDSADVRANPDRALRRLCEQLDIPFDPAMLEWKTGGISQDGVWAAHWYGAVHRSTGFAGAEDPLPVLEGGYADLAQQALPYYEAIQAN